MIQINDNKGVTLIELIVAFSISVIVIGGIVFLMRNSTRNYREVNAEVSLQVEAQKIINQLNDLILEAYNVKYQDKQLKIYHKDTIYIITFDQDNNILLHEKVASGGETSGSQDLFGQYVIGFDVVDTGVDNRNNQLKISLELEYFNNRYRIEDHLITMRNRIKPVTE